MRFAALLNNCRPEEILKLQKMANDSLKYSIIDELKLGIKLLKRKDFELLRDSIKFLFKGQEILSSI